MKNVAFFFSAISAQELKKQREKKKSNDYDENEGGNDADEYPELSQLTSSTSQQWAKSHSSIINQKLCLSLALGKLQDAKLVIEHFDFQVDGSNIQTRNETVVEQARLSDKLTVLVNDIGIVMKKLGYALYAGKVYKKCDKPRYTCLYKCEVEAFVNSLAANQSFKAILLKNMKKIIDTLANPFCEVIRPLTVDYNLI